MEKDFDYWNSKKKKLDNHAQPPFFHERDIWWCSLGVNVGTEQDGRNDQFVRPVLILKRYSKDMALVAPLTRTEKKGRYWYTLRTHQVRGSRVVLSQMRTVSSKRLRARMARVPENEFGVIQEKIIELNFRTAKRKSPSEEGL